MSATTLTRNIAIVVGRGLEDTLICSCGETYSHKGPMLSNERVNACPKCNAKVELKPDTFPKANKLKLKPKLEVISKDNQHFHLRKSTEYLLLEKVGEKYVIKPKVGRVMELHFSFRTKEFTLTKSKSEITVKSEYELLESFTRGLEQSEIIAAAATHDTGNLFNFVMNEFGKEASETQQNFLRGFIRFLRRDKNGIGEKLSAAGFGRFIDTKFREQHGSLFYKEKIQDVFGVEKRHLPYIKKLEGSTIGTWKAKEMVVADDLISWNNMRYFYDYGLDYNSMDDLIGTPTTTFPLLVKNYGYNPKRLAEYLNREVRLLQGISDIGTATQLLYDYNRFMKTLGVEPEKYPRSLKKEHDLASMNLAIISTGENKTKFVEKVTSEDYTNLAYENEKFKIVIPSGPQALADEGTYLTHCVGNYVEDVINGHCKIFFLRHAKTEDLSLVTVEVRGKRVIQASGFNNRKLNVSEKEFVIEWCEKRELQNSAF